MFAAAPATTGGTHVSLWPPEMQSHRSTMLLCLQAGLGCRYAAHHGGRGSHCRLMLMILDTCVVCVCVCVCVCVLCVCVCACGWMVLVCLSW